MIESILRLFLAAFSGGLIGYEREKNGRPAGVRTHLLVCLGSCLTMLVSINLYELFKTYNTIAYASGVDPSRIASMVMAGIGFLGAGVIVKVKNGNVWRLTTAACLWVTAALGLAIGSGLYIPSIVALFISIISLMILKSLESYIKRDSYYRLEIHCDYSKNVLGSIKEILTYKKS